MSKNSPKQNIEAFLNWAGSRIVKDPTPVRKKRNTESFLTDIDPLDSTYII